MQLYDYQLLDKQIDTSKLTVDDISELLFASKHWADSLQKQAKEKNGAERTLRTFFWSWENGQKAYQELHDIKLLKSYAYQQYDLSMNKYFLNKMSNKYNVSNPLKEKLKEFISHNFDKVVESYIEILKEQPDDIKSWYRLGHAIAKEKDASNYEMTPPKYQKYKNKIYDCYNNVTRLYQEKGKPESCRREYIHAKYGIVRNIYKDILDTFDINWNIKEIWNRRKIKLRTTFQQPNECINLLRKTTWTPKDLARANDILHEIKQELAYPDQLDDFQIKKIASEKEPVILPFYLYYTQAKIYLTMALCWNSNIYIFYKCRTQNEQLVWDNFKHYWELALQNSQYALALRDERQALGFIDSKGAAANHIVTLAAMIYALSLDFDISNLQKLKERFPKISNIEYYYWICYYHMNPAKNAKRVIQEFTIMQKHCRNKSIKKQYENIVHRIRNEKI